MTPDNDKMELTPHEKEVIKYLRENGARHREFTCIITTGRRRPISIREAKPVNISNRTQKRRR